VERFELDPAELHELIVREIAEAESALWGDYDLAARIDAHGYETGNPNGLLADRRTRAEVAYYYALPDGVWLPTRLRRYDQVMLIGVVPCVVAMPARGREYFLAYAPAHYGQRLVRLRWDLITARAPYDPQEPGMPLTGGRATIAQVSDVTDEEFFSALEEPTASATKIARRFAQLARVMLNRQIALWRYLKYARATLRLPSVRATLTRKVS